MLAQTRNEHSSEFQTTMCIYLLACGASRTQFDVLNHAGFTLSYTAAIRKIKELGQEKLLEIVGLVGRRAFMIIWDNLNIAFWVGEQRKALNDILIMEQLQPSYHYMVLNSAVFSWTSNCLVTIDGQLLISIIKICCRAASRF